MITRHLETLYCDDIRHEIGGKISYIGVYSGTLYVSAFPVILPKLCVAIQVVTPADMPLQALTLRLFKDEALLQEMVFNGEQLAADAAQIEEVSDGEQTERAHHLRLALVFSPMQFETPGILRVRAQTEEGELRGLALKVEATPTS